jgi:rubrerythrin
MRESIDPTKLGPNRTGMQTSPKHSKELSEIIDTLPTSEEDRAGIAAVRREYILDADPLGSVPPPATVKGMAKSGAKMLTGNRPQAFIDKLSERLAFERGGTRLYDAVLVKFMAMSGELPGVSEGDVLEIRNEEARHALLIKECLEQLGADPTAQTPCADLVGVETMGLMQAVTDPRTTLAQTLHAALSAELVDNDGWETLIAMAESMGQKQMAEKFREALQREVEHLTNVRSWYQQLTLGSGKLAS